MCKVTDFGMARDVQQENFYERTTKVCDLFFMIVHDLLYNVRLSFEATSSVKWKYHPIMKEELTRRKKGVQEPKRKTTTVYQIAML